MLLLERLVSFLANLLITPMIMGIRMNRIVRISYRAVVVF
jgi:hypothetical protein